MTAIKTEEERARLDELYALVETENAAAEAETENPEPTNPTKEKSTEPPSSIAGNLRTLLREGNITKREKWISSNYINLYETHIPAMKAEISLAHRELNRLSNFAMAIIQRLDNCERAAREQDNHHYYKIFADSVRKLTDKLQGGADVENVKNIRSLALCKEKLKVQTSIAEEMEKMAGTYHTSYAEAVKDLYEKNKEIRRQKHKRCKAIARWCFTKSNYHFVVGRSEGGKTGMTHYRISSFYSKWYKRWMKLAEKFKESK